MKTTAYTLLLLAVLSLASCSGSNPDAPHAKTVISASVHSETGAEAGKLVELPKTGETQTTDTEGRAVFVVPPGDYVVRAYEINTGGPGMLFVEKPVTATAHETTEVSFFDCQMCVGPIGP